MVLESLVVGHRTMAGSGPVAFILLLLITLCASLADAHDALREQVTLVTTQIAAEPRSAELYLRRGELRRALGESDAAHADLDRAAELNPRLIAVHLARARLHMDDQRPAAALASATTFLAAEPGNVQALLLRARAGAQLGSRQQAVADFSRAIAIQPRPDTVIERARLLQAVPADLEQALDGIEDGMRRIGNLVTLQIEALEIERRLRRYDAALSRLDVVTARAARKERWLLRRGALLEEAGRPSDALPTYQSALAAALALPTHLQGTRATSALVSDLHTRIGRLSAALRGSGTSRSISR